MNNTNWAAWQAEHQRLLITKQDAEHEVEVAKANLRQARHAIAQHVRPVREAQQASKKEASRVSREHRRNLMREKELKAIRLRYVDQLTLKAIGEQMNIHPTYASSIIARGIRVLRHDVRHSRFRPIHPAVDAVVFGRKSAQIYGRKVSFEAVGIPLET